MKKVIIIGAGPAGLTAAHELLTQSKDYEVVLLEELDQIAGLSRTVCYKDNRIALGGHRFYSKDNRVMEWCKKRMPFQETTDGLNPEKDEEVMLLRRRVSRIYYNEKFFDYPITMKAKTFILIVLVMCCILCFSKNTLKNYGDVILRIFLLIGERNV